MKNLIPYIIILALLITGCNSTQTIKKTLEENESNFSVSVLDVGKGDCIILRSESTTVVIDTGYVDTSSTVINYLNKNNIDTIDYMIITHYDKDHVGGAAKILNEINVAQVYLPAYKGTSKYYESMMSSIKTNNISADIVSSDITFNCDSISYKIYATDIEYNDNDNDVSLIVSVVNSEDSFLFTGDIEKTGIDSFLKKIEMTYDVIKMPHHGLKESNTDNLIEAAAPKIAIITDSQNEPADKKVLDLLEENGVSTYRSSLKGSYTIFSYVNGNFRIAEISAIVSYNSK
jgi:beta-lactamase superfamily II metal-dependent hydrolase